MRDFTPDRDDPHDALLDALEAHVRALDGLGLGVQVAARLARLDVGVRCQVPGVGEVGAASSPLKPETRNPKPDIDHALRLDVLRQAVAIAGRTARTDGHRKVAAQAREIVRDMIVGSSTRKEQRQEVTA